MSLCCNHFLMSVRPWVCFFIITLEIFDGFSRNFVFTSWYSRRHGIRSFQLPCHQYSQHYDVPNWSGGAILVRCALKLRMFNFCCFLERETTWRMRKIYVLFSFRFCGDKYWTTVKTYKDMHNVHDYKFCIKNTVYVSTITI
jgi:hypothetical protein